MVDPSMFVQNYPTVFVLNFLLAWAVSAVVIYFVTKMFGETEGPVTSILTALVGAGIYTITYYAFGHGLAAAFIAGVAWLLALKHMYGIGWTKSAMIAIVVWILASVLSLLLPTVQGPL